MYPLGLTGNENMVAPPGIVLERSNTFLKAVIGQRREPFTVGIGSVCLLGIGCVSSTPITINLLIESYLLSEPSQSDYQDVMKYNGIDVSLVHESTIFLFVLQSKDSNREKRKRIRHTWSNRRVYNDYYHNPIYVIFTLGLPTHFSISNKPDPILRDVIEEAHKTKDILLLNMMGMHNNLTIKGFLTMLWIESRGLSKQLHHEDR
ncbi:hypothetical protein LSH36_1007g01006 [Paralvinella palmiformis]|uniref:Hexosyltransferase n=1 Tax=Paralvinella palmiformis TaxID=53620 RepID=A0AAD9MT33_9ANNE|nr:hypothetical protein LSH36_1007g01006 [Paralvinella palmiformis]